MISCFFQYPVEGVSGDLIKGTEFSSVHGENKIRYNVCNSYKFDAVVCIAYSHFLQSEDKYCRVFFMEVRNLDGFTWWRSWLRHCATSWKVAGLITDDVIEGFH